MIIQIRGTSGSGKSTIVRDVLAMGHQKVRFTRQGRRQPVGYLAVWEGTPQEPGRKVAIPGHYETACGGCDTLPSYDDTFALVRQGRSMTDRVLFEGLLVAEEVKRTVELHNSYPGELVVIQLTTDVETCLESIRARRAARGDTRPLKEDNTRNRVKTIEKACEKLREAGVRVIQADRDEAKRLVLELLR